MSSLVPDDAPKPRLCHIKKKADFQGYGFNLHAEKGKSGQYIGKVDDNSPAETAGLLHGDRIVEVNGTNIGNENHQQVVQRIKAVPDETKLFVVDHTADAYYKEKKIVVRGDMPGILCLPELETPADAVDGGVTKETSTVETIAQVNHEISPAVNGDVHKAQEDLRQEEATTEVTVTKVETTETKVENAGEVTTTTVVQETVKVEANSEPVPEPVKEPEAVVVAEPVVASEPAPAAQEKAPEPEVVAAETVVVAAAAASEPEPVVEVETKPVEPEPESPPPDQPTKPRDPNDPFAISAAEMRERLTKRKKQDVKSANLSTVDKYAMYQRL